MKNNNQICLELPTEAAVKKYIDEWKKPKWQEAREKKAALEKLFHEIIPKTTNIEDAIIKVAALNDCGSTHIPNTYVVSQHLLDIKDLDDNLEKGNLELVNKIATIQYKDKKYNLYSFASKYCNHHRPAVYPIYDSYVAKVLANWMLNYDEIWEKMPNCSVKRTHKGIQAYLENYENFVSCLTTIKALRGLENFDHKKFDIYLWLLGKEKFPKTKTVPQTKTQIRNKR